MHGTPVALTNPAYIPTALAGAAVAFVVQIEHKTWDRAFILVDAAALSLWATAGALKAMDDGLGWLPEVLIGTITAIGGAITRDVMLQRVPAVFTQGTLYATVAIIVAAIQVSFVGRPASAPAAQRPSRSPSASRCGSSRTGAAGSFPAAWTGRSASGRRRAPGDQR